MQEDQPQRFDPALWSYRYGLFLGALTFSGFLLELALETGQAELIAKRAIAALAAVPFFIHAFSKIAASVAKNLDVPGWIGAIFWMGFLVISTIARDLYVRFSFVVVSLVFILMMYALVKKGILSLRGLKRV